MRQLLSESEREKRDSLTAFVKESIEKIVVMPEPEFQAHMVQFEEFPFVKKLISERRKLFLSLKNHE